MANRRKHEAFNKIHSLWIENYNFISLPFNNITEDQTKTKIVEILNEITNKNYHLHDKENICKAIAELTFYKKLQINSIQKIDNDIKIFKKELNESVKALIGFETIRLYENAKYDIKNAVKMLDSDINAPESKYKIHFDAIYKTRDQLLDSMIQLNKAKANSQVICKLVKMITSKLHRMTAEMI